MQPGPLTSPAAWECGLALLAVLSVGFGPRTGLRGWLPNAIWLLFAVAAGFLIRNVGILTIRRSISSISGDFVIVTPAPKQASGWLRTWEAWKRFTRRVADYQSHVLLTVFYFSILAPVAVWVSTTKNPLRLHTRESGWVPHPQSDTSLQDARRQF